MGKKAPTAKQGKNNIGTFTAMAHTFSYYDFLGINDSGGFSLRHGNIHILAFLLHVYDRSKLSKCRIEFSVLVLQVIFNLGTSSLKLY